MSGIFGIIALVAVIVLFTASYFVLLANRKIESGYLKKFGSVIAAALWIAALLVIIAGIYLMSTKRNFACQPGSGPFSCATGGTPVICPVPGSPGAPCLSQSGGTPTSPQSSYYENNVSTKMMLPVLPPSVCVPTPLHPPAVRYKMDSDKAIRDKQLKCGK